MLARRGFYAKDLNERGVGLQHNYEMIEPILGQKLVIDHTTGLTWQQSGSSVSMTYAEAEQYVGDLNTQNFGGYNDWRLPTLEEAMSLMEPQKKNRDLHIDPVFDWYQRYLWTADKNSDSKAWVVNFDIAYCPQLSVNGIDHVRAVRDGKKNY